MDAPQLRYQRILLPLFAFLLAGGRASLVDPAYVVLILLSIFLGTYWLGRVLEGRPSALAFLLLPATIVSLDRLTPDVALAAACCHFALSSRTGLSWRLYPTLAIAPLIRETGSLLLLAAVISSFSLKEFRKGVLLATAILPALGWYLFVRSRTPDYTYPASLVPLSGFLRALLHPAAYPDKPGPIARLDQGADALALLGILIAFASALALLRHWPLEPVPLATVLFGLLGVFFQKTEHWLHVFDFRRVYSPLLLFLGILGRERFRGVLSVGLMGPRILLQLGSQLTGVLYGIFR